MLKVKLLSERAIKPTLGHPGEDLGYDLYTDYGGVVPAHGWVNLTTGVACEFTLESEPELKWGFIVKPRSSLGQQGFTILGGVIDAGYRGEIHLMVGSFRSEIYEFDPGQKIANLIPIPVVAKKIEVVSTLSESHRGIAAFGSTGS